MLTAFHLQTDGFSERSNKTVVQALRFHVEQNQSGWAKALPKPTPHASSHHSSTWMNTLHLIHSLMPHLLPKPLRQIHPIMNPSPKKHPLPKPQQYEHLVTMVSQKKHPITLHLLQTPQPHKTLTYPLLCPLQMVRNKHRSSSNN